MAKTTETAEEIKSLKKIVGGAGVFLVGVVASKFITYFTRIYLARYFGPGDYGLFSLGLAVVGFFSVFGVLGLHAGVSRYIPYFKTKKEEARVKGVLVFALLAVALASIILTVVLFISSQFIATTIFHKPELVVVLKILSLSIPFASLFSVLTSSFEGFQFVKYRVYTDKILLNVLKLILIILFGVTGYGVLGIAYAYTFATVLIFFIALYITETKVFSLRKKIRSVYIKKELLIFSLPLMLYGFIKSLDGRISILILGFFMGVDDVGIYNVAIPTAQILTITIGSLGVLFLPVITELYAKNDKESLKKVYKTVSKWAFYINVPISLILIFFSGQIISILFGQEYIRGASALSILAAGFFLRTLSFTAHSILIMAKKTRAILLIHTLTLLTNVAVSIILIPIYGVVGAAVAMTAAISINAIIIVTYTWHVLRLSPFSVGMLKSIPSGILSIGVVYLGGGEIFGPFNADQTLVLSIPFCFIYVFTLLQFSGLQKEDVEILKSIEKKTGIRIAPLRNFIKRFIK